ncbi:MAG: hypothetical protein QF775_01125 [archaeon]|jgi:hypothetical protein|nr:hypothetical protein [Euryarchaeota archaeon]MDP6704069.1 hypothetical protein [archaeon]HIK01440.1 hypothetical protein [Candidatus Undinarchaeales archaeon ERR594346 U_76725]|tara:strand:- start:354 stop:902 length:549 start_codon:yes stop_codon:yes gene_type:complete
MFKPSLKELEKFYKRLGEQGFEPGKPWFYVSGALTGVSNIKDMKKFYEELSDVVMNHGGFAYVPHRVTDPKEHPDVSPMEVYEVDMKAVINCRSKGAMVTVLEHPSLGVGAEIQKSFSSGVKMIYIAPAGKGISRLILGGGEALSGISENISIIEYKNHKDALKKFSEHLDEYFSVEKGYRR